MRLNLSDYRPIVFPMKKIVLILFLYLNLCLLTGCWDRTEVNDLAIVTGIGLDEKSKKGIELTIQMFVPKMVSGGQAGGGGGGGGGGGETLYRSGTGTTIANALANLQEKIPREVFWGHTKVIVISEKLAKEGIREPMDYLARHPEPRLRAHVYVSKGKAKDVMALLPPLERSSAEVLRELSESEILIETTLKDFLQMLISEAATAAVPMVDILPPQKGQSELQSIGFVNRTAIFKKDKMIGHIDARLTRGVLWLRDEIEQATITVRPEAAKGGHVSAALIRAHTKLLPEIEDGKWKMTVKTVAEDDLVLNGTNLSLMDPEITNMVGKELEKEIENRIQSTLQKVQKEMRADIFGFAEAFYHKYPKEWEKMKDEWDDVFPKVEVKVEAKVYVRRPGSSTAPQGLPEKEVKKK